MPRSITDIRVAIDAIVPVEGEYEGWKQTDLETLVKLVDAYFAQPEAASNLDVWFALFERFPESDAYGVFWSILHGIERFDKSGELAVASVRRRPTMFPVMMINRMINGGAKTVGDADLAQILTEAAASQSAPASVRDAAADFLEHQRTKT